MSEELTKKSKKTNPEKANLTASQLKFTREVFTFWDFPNKTEVKATAVESGLEMQHFLRSSFTL